MAYRCSWSDDDDINDDDDDYVDPSEKERVVSLRPTIDIMNDVVLYDDYCAKSTKKTEEKKKAKKTTINPEEEKRKKLLEKAEREVEELNARGRGIQEFSGTVKVRAFKPFPAALPNGKTELALIFKPAGLTGDSMKDLAANADKLGIFGIGTFEFK